MMWLPYLSLPVGLSYFAFEFILAMFKRWRDLAKPASPDANAEAMP